MRKRWVRIRLEKDIKHLQEYKKQVSANLAKQFRVTKETADKILSLLEAEDFIRIEAPKYQDKPATVLTTDRQLVRDELGMTSRKAGNIILNTYLDWGELVKVVLGAASTMAGIDAEQPFFACVGILSVLFSVSELTEVKISEKGTAIIMALQKYKKHRTYMATEELCKKEANEILLLHGYDEMDEAVFRDEITRLIKCKCIDSQSGLVLLKEKVISHY